MKKTFFLSFLLSLGFLLAGCNQSSQVPGAPDCPDGSCPVPEIEPAPEVKEFPFRDYLRATCRVRISGSGGSGTCFKIDGGYVYVLTCRHVVGSRGKGRSASVEFWMDGKLTGKYTGEIIKVSEIEVTKYSGKVVEVLKVDAAVIAVSIGNFQEDELPLALPISQTPPKAGDVVVSAGCLGLAWQTLWEGHVTGYSGKSFTFIPKPGGGRSGSGIFADGEIVGVLWGAGNGGGYAVSCGDLKELWNFPESKPETPGGEQPPCPHCGE